MSMNLYEAFKLVEDMWDDDEEVSTEENEVEDIVNDSVNFMKGLVEIYNSNAAKFNWPAIKDIRVEKVSDEDEFDWTMFLVFEEPIQDESLITNAMDQLFGLVNYAGVDEVALYEDVLYRDGDEPNELSFWIGHAHNAYLESDF